MFGNANFLFYLSGAVALFLVTIVLNYNSSLWVLCIVIVIGACAGVFSSHFIRGLCETEMLRESAKAPLFAQWREIKKNPLIRQILIAGFCRNVALILTGPPSILMLKKGYGFSDMGAVMFSISQLVACFLFSWLTGPLTVKKGPRFVMIWGLSVCLFVSILWLLSPFSLALPVYFIGTAALFSYGIAMSTTDVANICYFLMVTPKEQQVAGSVVLNLFQGAGAGLTGMGIASGLIWVSEQLTPFVQRNLDGFLTAGGENTVVYKIFFMLVIPFYLFIIYQAIRLKTVISGYLEKHGESGVRRTVDSGGKGSH
jgi:MFS family permease